MNKQEIVSEKIFVKSIFTDMWFRIPEYQRPYVWTSEEVVELLNDIIFNMELKPDKEYFLGSFVFQKKKANNVTLKHDENDLLDGQQRLITLTLLFAVIRDVVSDNDAKQVCQECIYQKGNQYKQIPERMRLQFSIREDVEIFLNKYIKEINGTRDINLNFDQLNKTCTDLSVKNMMNSVKVIDKYLREKEINTGKLLEFILNNVLLIYVSTEDLDDAFRLFTILNDRGIPLRNSDILKSINLGELKEDKEKLRFAQVWEDAENNLGEDFDRFLNHVRTLILKDKARANLLQEYQEKIYDKNILNKGKDTFEVVEKFLDIHRVLFGETTLHIDNSFMFDNLLKVMKLGLPSNDWVPALMAYFNKYKYENIYNFLTKLDNKFSADWVAQYSPTTRFENICEILKQIDKSNSSDELLNSKCLQFDQLAFKRVLEGDVYGRKFAKYILLKMDYYFQNHDQKLNTENVSIEHILPQNPKEDSQWCVDFNPQERVELVDVLGNLVLITSSKNSSQGRLDFKEKKSKYFSKRIDVSVNSLRILQKYDEWKLLQLKENQEFVLQVIYKKYGLS